jgi:hypothetical protein
MEIPAEVTVRVCIEQGSVYHYLLESINNDGILYKGKRFLVVLNKDPKTDMVLILVTVTKQVEHQKEYIKRIGEDPSTLVSISKVNFPRLSVDSVVNCNDIYETSMADLINDIENGGKVFFEKLPKIVIDDLLAGVMKSNMVSLEHKELLL